MVMWETMALSSYFLVTANHRIAEVRSAGYLYITMARVGAIAILLCFGVLQANTGDYTFANMRAQALSGPFWGSVGFLLAGAGLWRQGRHPAAARVAARGASGRTLARCRR
jgi:hydrogenase-4 component B